MSPETEYLFIVIGVQSFLNIRYPYKLEQGKITRLMKKPLRWPTTGWTCHLGVFRLGQMFLFWGIDQYVWKLPYSAEYYIIIVILYLDDLYFDDDDKWKKRWQTVKNKIKWKMHTPQTAPQHESA